MKHQFRRERRLYQPAAGCSPEKKRPQHLEALGGNLCWGPLTAPGREPSSRLTIFLARCVCISFRAVGANGSPTLPQRLDREARTSRRLSTPLATASRT
jgi:hypothetical protein